MGNCRGWLNLNGFSRQRIEASKSSIDPRNINCLPDIMNSRDLGFRSPGS